MRFLLISDTHGKLGIINELAERTQADAVIHAGDFGFYDDGSYERLSDRELRLLVIHSDLSKEEKDRILASPFEEQIAIARQRNLVGEFQSYLDGTKSFRVPVYAVWGNHEDKETVERLFRGDLTVPNLNMLHHERVHRIGPALIYGLGGNLLPGSKMLQKPIAGGGGKIWSTLSQYTDLVRTCDNDAEGAGVRIFVSHVSPGKEPFIELLGARTRAAYTISGHMGTPNCMIWNPFAIESVDESVKRLQDGLEAVKAMCMDAGGPETNWVGDSLDFIGRLPEDMVHIGRGVKAPRWYRSMTHVNLPDAHIGYAVLDVDGETTTTNIQTCMTTQ